MHRHADDQEEVDEVRLFDHANPHHLAACLLLGALLLVISTTESSLTWTSFVFMSYFGCRLAILCHLYGRTVSVLNLFGGDKDVMDRSMLSCSPADTPAQAVDNLRITCNTVTHVNYPTLSLKVPGL